MKLPKIVIGAIWLFLVSFTPKDVSALIIASQDQAFSDQFYVWQTIQELGSNLSGTVSSFTFRIDTSSSNLNQFDYTAQNIKIYDKDNNNSYINACVTSEANPLEGLTFTSTGIPDGYKDVTVDFSCRNYNFITGHRYLVWISNANMPQWGGKTIRFAATSYSGNSNDYFSGGGLRYANGNPWDYSHNSGRCNPATYIWNDQTTNPASGCNIWGTAKADLYFVLNNNFPPPPPPKLPVIFIPGIGGSEMKATQDIVWSKDDGHGGTYSHAYAGNEKIWVNQDKAAELGNDDYFDVLRLKTDGVTPEADLSLTGNLTSFGYPDIDSFFTGMGYAKGTNFFVFPYDWRKDVRSTKDSLDALIESAKKASGQPKVNLVVHSMGGLVARYYISDAGRAAKINKLIELGVPHLGSVDATKALIYGKPLGRQILGDFYLGVPAPEVKDLFRNLPAAFQLLPSKAYFNFYDNSDQNQPFPFKDDRDIDKNKVIGSLNYDQTKTLLSNLAYNMVTFGFGEEFHNPLDPILNQTNGTNVYEIVGTAQPTLGQIFETWWVTWPINLISKTDEIFINGDNTVPFYSASLKSDSLDISGATKIYYVEQKHSDLVSSSGTAMQTVKAILNEDSSLPVEVKDQKISLEGEQISLDDGELDLYDDQNRHCGLNDKGEIEENIPEITCTASGNTKHAFVKKKAAKVKVKATRKNPAISSKTTNLKKRTYREDKISKTTVYKDINIPQAGKIEFNLDPSVDTSPTLTFYPDSSKETNILINSTSEVNGSAASDQTPPSTSIQISGAKDSAGIYTGPVTITLTGTDSGSGILKIEYSLDNGQTVQTYTGPFIISASGKTTIQIKATDKLGNEEIPQSIVIEIAASPTPTPTSTPVTTNTSSSANTPGVGFDSPGVNATASTTTPVIARSTSTALSVNTPGVGFDSPGVNSGVLGLTFKNPGHISDQINVSGLLDQEKNAIAKQNQPKAVTEFLGGLLIVSGGIVTLASVGLLATFLKPMPK